MAYEAGYEKIAGATLYNANLARLVNCQFESEALWLPIPVDAQLSVPSVRPYDRIVKMLRLAANDANALPTGAGLIVQLKVGATVLTQQYTLGSGAAHALVDVSGDGNGGADPFTSEADDLYGGPGVLVTADAELKAYITSAATALSVIVTPIWRPRVL
jgi:hypothetical protein